MTGIELCQRAADTGLAIDLRQGSDASDPNSGTFPLTGWARADRFDLARLELMERRLQALEDAEAIRI